jgi:hypothetical protein
MVGQMKNKTTQGLGKKNILSFQNMTKKTFVVALIFLTNGWISKIFTKKNISLRYPPLPFLFGALSLRTIKNICEYKQAFYVSSEGHSSGS